MKKTILGLLFLCSLSAPAHATYYWASTAGSHSATCANIDSADSATDPGSYGTINRAANCATAAGDTVIIKAGTYTGTNHRIKTDADCTGSCLASGTSESVRTTIMADPAGATPVISVAFWFSSFMTAPRNYITIKNLKLDVSNGAGSIEADSGGSTITIGGHHVTVENVEIINSYNHAIFAYYGATTHHVVIRNSRLRGFGIDGNGYGIYMSGDDATIENNEIYSGKGGGLQTYSDFATVDRPTIRYNYIHDISQATQSGYVGGCFGIATKGNASLVYRNVVDLSSCGAGGSGSGIANGYNTNGSLLAYHNTVTGARESGIYVGLFAATSGNIITNNHIVGNFGGQITVGSGASATQTTNRTTGSLTDCTAGSTTYTQKAASSCIDAGTAIVGYAYNGSAPDQGAFETFVFSVCSVEDGDASNLRVTYTNNVFPPLLPSSGATGTTSRKAGVANTTATGTRVGDSRYDHTLTNAIVNGNTVDISTTTTNKTDSANIGGSSWAALVQPYVQTLTNQSCTNNVGAAASHLFIQARFEFHGLRGTEAAPVVLPYSAAAENTNINVVVGGKARLRLAVTCTTADCPPTGFYLYYSKDGGAYAVVPDTFGADNIAFCGTGADSDIPTSGTATTDQLSTAGTFVAAALVRTSNAIPTIDLAQNNKTEPEYCLSWDTDATADATYDFRIYKQDATAIDTYTVTPRATVRAMSAGLGF